MTSLALNPAVSVVIVTYNSATTINLCLTRLATAMETCGEHVQVIVWDNASSDDTVQQVEHHQIARDGKIHLVASKDNLGFGGGNNAAAANAIGDTLLLLNPDAFLDDPNAIGHLLEVMRKTGAGIVGPFLENADGSHQVGDAGYGETLGVAATWALGLSMVPGFPGSYLSQAYPPSAPPRPIDWICGACLMIERRLFETLGGFDPRIFLYSEDVDLCLRAGRIGTTVLYVPAIRVRHVQGVSLSDKGVSTTWLESRFQLFERAYHNPVRHRLFAILLAFGFTWRGAAYRLIGISRSQRSMTDKATKMAVYANFAFRRAVQRTNR